MRFPTLALTAAMVLAGGHAAHAFTAPGVDAPSIALQGAAGDFSGGNTGISAPIDEVKPGETFTITGACVTRANSADGLRVVLMLAEPGAAPGYHALIATDHEMQADGLEVRAPHVPEAASRVFEVRVFHLDKDVATGCDAGRIRIDASAPSKVS